MNAYSLHHIWDLVGVIVHVSLSGEDVLKYFGLRLPTL